MNHHPRLVPSAMDVCFGFVHVAASQLQPSHMPCPAGPESNPHALSCRLGLERLPPPFVNAVRLFLLDVTGALAVSKPLLCPDPCPSSNPCMARTITTVVAVAICPVRTVPYSSEPVTACVPL